MTGPDLRQGGRLGRFELRRELGRGAQARVWLAHDPLLQRDVALKVLDLAASEAVERDHWLHEARAVSALSHPHVVPVFEAVDAAGGDGRVYLVFEYVEGPTLAQASRQRGRWPPVEAVRLMLGVLDALAAAHALGLVHRDLKPSNILLGQDGRARVMDFGIAARIGIGPGARAFDPGEGLIVGSPGYISPEAARAEPPAPTMDVFAAGVILAELLAGEALLKERDPMRALERVQREDLRLSADVRVDDVLRGIVGRALEREAGRRFDGARAMHAALDAWLNPEASPAGDADHGGHATLEFLLRRMRHKTDFPALSDSVLRIQRLAGDENARLAGLADEVLNDVALTSKLLRMVNSVHFASAGSGQITTVSRAVALVGFAGIRNMAMAVLLLEHMKDRGQAELLRREFVHALTAGVLAAELEPRARESEEAFLAALLQNLGRLLAEFYFPEEAERIRQLASRRAAATPGWAAEGSRLPGGDIDAAAAQVLGLTLDDLGAGVARAWGLPEGLQKAMRRPPGEPPARALVDRGERLRWLGDAANALADAMTTHGPEALDQALETVGGRYAQALGVSPAAAREAAQAARHKVSALARAMGLPAARKPSQPSKRPLASKAAQSPAEALDWPGQREAATVRLPPPRGEARRTDPVASAGSGTAATLAAGRVRIEQGLAGRRLSLDEVLRLSLQALQDAFACRNVVFCLREARGATPQRLRGRLALGPVPARLFEVCPATQGDLISVVSARAIDTLIADASSVATRMPAWWREQVRAGTFLLLPLAVRGAPLGLIYADREEPRSLAPSEPDLAAVRALRDAVVGAFASGLR